jgi:hypothetical protein
VKPSEEEIDSFLVKIGLLVGINFIRGKPDPMRLRQRTEYRSGAASGPDKVALKYLNERKGRSQAERGSCGGIREVRQEDILLS